MAIDVRGLQIALRNSPDGGLGGVGRYCLDLVASLLRRSDDARYLLLIDHGPIPRRLEQLVDSSSRASMHRIGPRRLRFLRRGRVGFAFDVAAAPFVDRQIRRLRPDVVHLLDQPASIIWLRPRIATFHDFYSARTSSVLLRERFPSLLLRRVLKQAAAADLVVCVSQSTARLAGALLACDPGRTRVVYPGIDTSVFRPSAADPGDGRKPSTPPYFLHVGVLRARKNPAGLLHAFREVAESNSSIELICAGPYQVAPNELGEVRRLASHLGIEDRVRFAQDVTDEKLVALYQGAIALVLPSHDEGFGYPAVEALACGTPCVVSKAGSLPEVAGVLGVLVDPDDPHSIADGMRRAMEDQRLRDRVRADGPIWSERFSSQAMAGCLADSYRRLAAGRDFAAAGSGSFGAEAP